MGDSAAEAEAILKKELQMARDAKQTLESQRRLVKEPAIRAQMGEISKQIYSNGQLVQTDCLSALPNELKCHIWSFIEHPADRLMFAITCKWNAAMFEMLKIGPKGAPPASIAKTSKSSSKKASTASTDKKGPATKLRKPSVKQSDFVHLISVLQRLEKWMPPRYRLCYECLRFRRKDLVKETFIKDKGRVRGSWTPGVTMALKKRVNVKAVRQNGAHCPECGLRRKLDVLKLKGEFKELQHILSDTVGVNS
ncbi:hypothetical protein LTR70_000239 [Exophiala xenobiotica]|nr:hypothetical protein LTR70_000239 [Exophiala xenobiotica]